MIETASPTLENPESTIQAGPCFHLEASALARLESLAKARGVSAAVALHELLEAAIGHLQLGNMPPTRVLSKKQVTVLESLQAGHSVKEIAAQLAVSEGTVRTHIRRMRRHLNRPDLLSLRYS
jgi:DNA-binding NarL/FixJ family response regulator